MPSQWRHAFPPTLSHRAEEECTHARTHTRDRAIAAQVQRVHHAYIDDDVRGICTWRYVRSCTRAGQIVHYIRCHDEEEKERRDVGFHAVRKCAYTHTDEHRHTRNPAGDGKSSATYDYISLRERERWRRIIIVAGLRPRKLAIAVSTIRLSIENKQTRESDMRVYMEATRKLSISERWSLTDFFDSIKNRNLSRKLTFDGTRFRTTYRTAANYVIVYLLVSCRNFYVLREVSGSKQFYVRFARSEIRVISVILNFLNVK